MSKQPTPRSSSNPQILSKSKKSYEITSACSSYQDQQCTARTQSTAEAHSWPQNEGRNTQAKIAIQMESLPKHSSGRITAY